MDDFARIQTHFRLADPVIYPFLKKVSIDQWVNQPVVTANQQFQNLTRHIISQQLSTKVAQVITVRFVELLGGKDYTPNKILLIADKNLRSVGLSRAKISYIKDLAQKTVDNQLPYSKFFSMPEEEVITSLIQVKGIGRWTAEMFLMFSLGREDIFSYGDWGLKTALKKVYQLPSLPTVDEAQAITDVWRPYRSYGSFALWQSLEK